MQVSVLQSCLDSLQIWFCGNLMVLNPDKSDSILFGTSQREKFFHDLDSVNVSGTVVPLARHLKLLGVVLDANLTVNQHTQLVSRSFFYHIRALCQIRHLLDHSSLSGLSCLED